ncbi:MAG: hypothetical protein ACRDTG_11275 [Pseudonocardiaceae bacterium]
MSDPGAVAAENLLRGLRRGTVVMMGVILWGLDLPMLVLHAAVYRPLWLEVAAFAVFAVVAGWGGLLLWRNRLKEGWRWVLVVAVFVASVAATAAVSPAFLVVKAHWSFGIVGWYGVLLFMDRRPRALLEFLAVHHLLTVMQLALAGRADLASLASLAIKGVLVAGSQLGVGLAIVVMRQVALVAARTAAAQEHLRTAETVAERIHTDRQTRYAAMADTLMPLLRELATGRLDPADLEVRRACWLEAARLRRLFAENDDVGDPLVHEVAACVDSAERRGVAVQLATQGTRPILSEQVRRELTEPVLTVLASTVSTARVTVDGSFREVTVSVVADAPDCPIPGSRMDRITVTSLRLGEKLWVQATWPAA